MAAYCLILWAFLVVMAHVFPGHSLAESGALVENMGIYGGIPTSIAAFYDRNTRNTELYAAFDSAKGIFKSSYNGTFWTSWEPRYDGDTLENALGHGKHAVVSSLDGTLWVNTEDAVVRSRDQGESWEIVLNDEIDVQKYPYAWKITALAIDSDNFLYAGTSFLASENNRCVIYRSTDGGETWTTLATVDKDSTSNVGGEIIFIGVAHNRVYAIVRYTIGGISYGSLRRGPDYNTPIGPNRSDLTDKTTGSYYTAGWDPENEQVIYLGGESLKDTARTGTPTIYYTQNLGTVWDEIVTSSEFAGGPPQYFRFRKMDGILQVFTGGRHRTSRTSLTEKWSDPKAGEGTLTFDPRSDTQEIWYTQSSRGIKRTINGGTNYEEFSNDLQSVSVYGMAQRGELAWAATSAGLFKNGLMKSFPKNWTAVSPPQKPSKFYSVALHPSDANIVLAGSDKVYRSADGGSLWSLVYDPLDALSATEKWEVSDIRFDPNDGTHVFAALRNSKGTQGEVVYSESQGEPGTWTRVFTTSGGPSTPVNTIFIASTYVLVGIGDLEGGQETGGIYKNVGVAAPFNWQQKTGGEIQSGAAYKIVQKPGTSSTYYVAGVSISGGTVRNGQLWNSVDDGDTWGAVKTFGGRSRAVVVNPDRPTEVYASSDEIIYKSIDEGNNWSLYRNNLERDIVRLLHFDDLLQGTDTGLYRFTGGSDEKKKKSKTNCFIATVCLSCSKNGKTTWSEEATEELETLRDFREKWLRPYAPGRFFIALYETHGPEMAHYIVEREVLRTSLRVLLIKPLVFLSRELLGQQVVLRTLLILWAFFYLLFWEIGRASCRERV